VLILKYHFAKCWTWKQLIDIAKIRINFRKFSSGNFRTHKPSYINTMNAFAMFPLLREIYGV